MLIDLSHSTNLITSCVKCYQELLLGTLKTGNGRTKLSCGSEKASCEGVKEAGGFTKGSGV